MDGFLEALGAVACFAIVLWSLGSAIFINTTYNLDVSLWGCTEVMDGKCSVYQRRAKN